MGLCPFVPQGFVVVFVVGLLLSRRRRVPWLLLFCCCSVLRSHCYFFVCCMSGKFVTIRKLRRVGQNAKTNSGKCYCFVAVFYVESLPGFKMSHKKGFCGQKSQIWPLYPGSGQKSQYQASTRTHKGFFFRLRQQYCFVCPPAAEPPGRHCGKNKENNKKTKTKKNRQVCKSYLTAIAVRVITFANLSFARFLSKNDKKQKTSFAKQVLFFAVL